MAITAAERNQVIELTVLMFNAAPGADYLSQIVSLYEANAGTQAQKLQALANQLSQTSVYRSLHPNFETAEEFAADFLTPLGLQADTVAKDFVIAKFNAGVSKGQIVYEAYAALNAVPSTGAAQYVAANAILNNKTTVAEYYSVTADGRATDLTTLQSVVASVTSTQASVDAAIATISGTAGGGQTFTLTTGGDMLTGTGANDTFNAPVLASGTSLIDSLQNIDQINGGAGTDTLVATLNTAAAVKPSLTSVENVNLRVTAAAELDLSASSGVTAVTVNNSTATAKVSGVGAAALGVANQTSNVDFTGSTATALNLNLNTVGTKTTDITVDLGKSAGNAATSFVVTANDAHVTLIESNAGAATTAATVASSGSNELTFAGADLASITALTVTGSGLADFTGGTFGVLKTLTAGDGGVKVTGNDTTATNLTATTGAGKDTLTFNGANVKSISTGAGDDSVTLNTSALAATATVSLGDGKDTITFQGAAPTAGATIDGGAGVDTFATTATLYGTVSGYTATQRALISNFEVLSITDTLANGSTTDVSSLTGVGSFTAAAGVAAGGTANVTKLGAGSTVTIAGANTATGAVSERLEVEKVVLSAFTGTAAGTDTYSVTVNGELKTTAASAYADVDAIGAALVTALGTSTKVTAAYDAATDTLTLTGKTGVGALTTTASGNADGADASVTATVTADVTTYIASAGAVGAGTLSVALATDTASDVVNLVLNNNYTENNDATATVTTMANSVSAASVETINVTSTGKASTDFLAAEGTKADGVKNILTLADDAVTALNVSGNQAFEFTAASTMTKLGAINASALTAGAKIDAASITAATAAALTITGASTAANTIIGSGNADTIVGGSKGDTITGGAGADTVTGGAGNDKFVFLAATDSTLAKMDVINDFSANTFGNSATTIGGAGDGANADATLWNGDVIQLDVDTGAFSKVVVSTQTNAADAQVFIQNTSAATADTIAAALDSSSGKLYIDWTSDGTVDSVVQLTGATTITAAAFQLI